MQVQGTEQGRVTPAGDANETGASPIPPAEASQAAKTDATDAPAKPEAGEPAPQPTAPKPVVEGSPLELARMQQAMRTMARDAQQLDTAYKGNADNARGQGDGKISWEDVQSRIKTLPDGALKSALKAIDRETFKNLARADRNVEIARLGQGTAGPATSGADLKRAAQALSGDARSLDIAYKDHAANVRGEGDGKISWEDIRSRIKTLPDGALKSALKSIGRDDFKQLSGGKRNIEISELGRFAQPTPAAVSAAKPAASSSASAPSATSATSAPSASAQGAAKIALLELNPGGKHAAIVRDIAEQASVTSKDNVSAPSKSGAAGGDQSRSNPVESMIQRIEQLAQNPGDIKVVNASVSSSPAELFERALAGKTSPTPAEVQAALVSSEAKFANTQRVYGDRINQAFDKLNEKGVTVVVAAGNSGEAEEALKQAGLAVPAGFHASLFYGDTERENVIVVGASESEGANAKAWGDSTPNANVDIAADGVQVKATIVENGQAATPTSDGTSFAAPYVAGKIADMIQQYPELKPADIKAAVKQAAIAGTGGLQTGAGVVDWALASQLAARAAKRAS